MNTPSSLLAAALCFFLFVTPRRFFLFPFIMAACFVPMNQKIIFFNLDFTLLRILIFVGFLRLSLKGETRLLHWNKFDKLILSWAVIGSLVYSVQQGTFDGIINRFGFLLDSIGMYWLFRQVVSDWEDVYLAIKIFAIFAIITAPLIALENLQESSFFSLFGPVQCAFHRGRFRAGGPFPHFIMMGCFWALLLPFFYARIKVVKQNMLFWVACLASLSNVIFSASSSSIMTIGAIIIFWLLYNYRMYGKNIFIITCSTLVLLHLIMKAPVWHLISRINIFSGSTGYHRFFLFDNFVRHVGEWFVLGAKSTEHWGYGQSDITNQFVLEGIRGGFVTLLLFILIIYNAVKIPGTFSLANITPEIKWISWGICVAMLGHFVTFWGVSYFGQIIMLLYFTFALIGFIVEQNTNIKIIPLTSFQ
jgi:hypothetical protein